MLLPLLLTALVIVADQLSKAWIVGNFAMFESREIIPGLFNFTYLTNKGAAFGLLNGNYGAWRQIFFVAIAVIALIVLIIALRQLREQGWIYGVALGLIAGGAAGNLLDRLRLGAVVDFLDFLKALVVVSNKALIFLISLIASWVVIIHFLDSQEDLGQDNMKKT